MLSVQPIPWNIFFPPTNHYVVISRNLKIFCYQPLLKQKDEKCCLFCLANIEHTDTEALYNNSTRTGKPFKWFISRNEFFKTEK